MFNLDDHYDFRAPIMEWVRLLRAVDGPDGPDLFTYAVPVSGSLPWGCLATTTAEDQLLHVQLAGWNDDETGAMMDECVEAILFVRDVLVDAGAPKSLDWVNHIWMWWIPPFLTASGKESVALFAVDGDHMWIVSPVELPIRSR